VKSKTIIVIAIILVVIGIGIAIGSDSEELQDNEFNSTPDEEPTPRILERYLTEGVGVAPP